MDQSEREERRTTIARSLKAPKRDQLEISADEWPSSIYKCSPRSLFVVNRATLIKSRVAKRTVWYVAETVTIKLLSIFVNIMIVWTEPASAIAWTGHAFAQKGYKTRVERL